MILYPSALCRKRTLLSLILREALQCPLHPPRYPSLIGKAKFQQGSLQMLYFLFLSSFFIFSFDDQEYLTASHQPCYLTFQLWFTLPITPSFWDSSPWFFFLLLFPFFSFHKLFFCCFFSTFIPPTLSSSSLGSSILSVWLQVWTPFPHCGANDTYWLHADTS